MKFCLTSNNVDKLYAVWLRICPKRQERLKKFSVPIPCHIEIVIHIRKFYYLHNFKVNYQFTAMNIGWHLVGFNNFGAKGK